MTTYELQIFKDIPSKTIDAIIASAPRESFSSGEYILMQGDPSNKKWYIIESGSVSVIIDNDIRGVIEEGNIFGEIALLNEDVRTATIQALEDTTCIIITQKQLLDLIKKGDGTINKEIIDRIEDNLSHEE